MQAFPQKLTHQACVQLLRELVAVAPACCTADTVKLLVPSLQASIGVRTLAACLLLASAQHALSSICIMMPVIAPGFWPIVIQAAQLNSKLALCSWLQERCKGCDWGRGIGIQDPCAEQDRQASREGLKIAAMTFMRLALQTAPAAAWQPHLAKLGPLVVAHTGERYYKVHSLALQHA